MDGKMDIMHFIHFALTSKILVAMATNIYKTNLKMKEFLTMVESVGDLYCLAIVLFSIYWWILKKYIKKIWPVQIIFSICVIDLHISNYAPLRRRGYIGMLDVTRFRFQLITSELMTNLLNTYHMNWPLPVDDHYWN